MQEIIATAKELLLKTDLTERELLKCETVIEAIDEAAGYVTAEIEDATKNGPAMGALSAQEMALESAPRIYLEKVQEAAAQSEEYAYDAFLSPLIDIGYEDSLYKLTRAGNGWGSKLSVHLAMDEVAGDIGDYAEAVESARASLGVKDDRDPIRASQIWKDKIYKGPRYFTTINLRLAAAVGKAPFWSLLNNGNKNTAMSSDIGGYAYPDVSPTHFVEETELAISREFEFQLMRQRDANVTYITDYQTMLREAMNVKVMLLKKIDDLSLNPEQMDVVAKEIGAEREKLSATKLYRAKEKLKRGEYLPAQIVVSGRGEKMKRIRQKKFGQIVSGFGE
jgi:hypothetical protein